MRPGLKPDISYPESPSCPSWRFAIVVKVPTAQRGVATDNGRSPVKFLLIHYIDESALSADSDGREVSGPEEDRALEAREISARHPTAKIGSFELRQFEE
jgi:hypothetical protein